MVKHAMNAYPVIVGPKSGKPLFKVRGDLSQFRYVVST